MFSQSIFWTVILVLFCLIFPLILFEYFIIKRNSKIDDKEIYLNEDGHHIYYDRSLIEKSHFLLKNPHIQPRELRTISRFYKEFFQSTSYQNTFGNIG